MSAAARASWRGLAAGLVALVLALVLAGVVVAVVRAEGSGGAAVNPPTTGPDPRSHPTATAPSTGALLPLGADTLLAAFQRGAAAASSRSSVRRRAARLAGSGS